MPSRDILIGASFTAEPLACHLQQQGAEGVSFIPAATLLSYLREPVADAASHTHFLLIRLEDLVREEKGNPAELARSLRRIGPLWLDAIAAHGAQLPNRPYLMVMPSPRLSRQGGQLAATCRALTRKLCSLPQVHLLCWSDFVASVPTVPLFDPVADQLGHVPMTLTGFAALGAWLMQQKRIPAPTITTYLPALLRPDALLRFHRRLHLQLHCHPMHELSQLVAAARLSRSATFHLSGRCLSEGQLQARLSDPAWTGLTIDAEDRFGRYRQCGFMLIRKGTVPCISEWALQTAVLGKQVEHCLLYGLAQSAQLARLPGLALAYVDQGRNLEMIGLIDAIYATAGGQRREVGTGRRLLDMAPSAVMSAVMQQAAAADMVADMDLAILPDWLHAGAQHVAA
ncbi:fkbH domain protein [Chitinivorax sp. B]|uniref:fkbH domain protein n=1 Tax=Chitinivorax sp. B TaxID=2502235 RepID=UPI0010F604CD|nr:fkbH domain protein [Chitinivorax sp. B]